MSDNGFHTDGARVLADLHALTVDVTPDELRSNVREMAATLTESTAEAGSGIPTMASSAPMRTLRRSMWIDICGLPLTRRSLRGLKLVRKPARSTIAGGDRPQTSQA